MKRLRNKKTYRKNGRDLVMIVVGLKKLQVIQQQRCPLGRLVLTYQLRPVGVLILKVAGKGNRNRVGNGVGQGRKW